MSLSPAFLVSDAVGSPVDVQHDQDDAKSVLQRDLVGPRLVLLRPGHIAIVGEFRLFSFFEVFRLLPDLLLGLQGEILIVSAPVVEVVVAEAESTDSRSSSQHKIL